MKKQLLNFLSILCLLFVLTGCQANPKNAQPTPYDPPIDGLRWGMTEEEVLSAMRLTREEVTREVDEYEDILLKLPDSYSFYGQETTQIELRIRTVENNGVVPGLFHIYGLLSETDTQKLQDSLTQTFGTEGKPSELAEVERLSWSGGQIPSQITDPKVLEGMKRFNNFGKENTMKNPIPGPFWDDVKDLGSVTVTLLTSDFTGEVYHSIQVDGFQAAAMRVLAE